MNFAFSEEQEELRRTVRAFLDQKSPETEVRRLMETSEGYEPAVWKQMASRWFCRASSSPRISGIGLLLRGARVVLEEMGRSLLCAPFFSTVPSPATC